MKQYMLNKPVKRGFKVWVRADSVTGYFCDFSVYMYIRNPSDGMTTEVGLGERVVLQLSEHLRGNHYQLYCDNFLHQIFCHFILLLELVCFSAVQHTDAVVGKIFIILAEVRQYHCDGMCHNGKSQLYIALV